MGYDSSEVKCFHDYIYLNVPTLNILMDIAVRLQLGVASEI